MAKCSVSFNSGCRWTKQAGNVVSTTSTNVYFQVVGGDSSQDGDDTYLASVTFQRTPTDTLSTSFKTYTIGEANAVSDSFVYSSHGHFQAGYSITFGSGAGSGCENKTFSEIFVVRNDEEGCELIEGLLAVPASSPNESAPIQSPTSPSATASIPEQETLSVNPINSSVPHQNHICAQSVYKAQDTCSFAPTCNDGDGACPKDLFCFPNIDCDSARISRQNYCAYTVEELQDSCHFAPTCNAGEVCPAGTSCFPNVACLVQLESSVSEGSQAVSSTMENPAAVIEPTSSAPVSSSPSKAAPATIISPGPSEAPVTSKPTNIIELTSPSPVSSSPSKAAPETIISPGPYGAPVTSKPTKTIELTSSAPISPSPSKAAPETIISPGPYGAPATSKPTNMKSFTWVPSKAPTSWYQSEPRTSSYASNAFAPTFLSGNGSLAIIIIICHYVLHI